MEKQRFRNHFSSIFEKMAGFLGIIIILFISETGDLIGEIATMKISVIPVLIGIGIFVLVVGAIFGWQFWVWSKTWIVLEENSISIEKNTFTLHKNTLGIKNISNVNVEQNLFEMILGTSKIKINTNSFSTANATDVKIILKKNEAEQLKQVLIERMEILNGNESLSEKNTNEDVSYDVKTSAKDIILNSIYSINAVWVVVAVLAISTFLGVIINLLEQVLGEENMEALFGLGFALVFVAVIIVVSIIYNLIRLYLKLYGFSVRRDNDKIYLKYGLFKQTDFSIPVDKINAIIIHQTFLARILRKYSVEIVNVGMGDDKEENTLVCLYGSKERVLKTIETILPEFASAVCAKAERQPKAVWVIYGIRMLVLFLILGIVGGMVVSIEVPVIIPICVISVIMLLSVILRILKFITTGMSISEEYLVIREGTFSVKHSFIKFEKVQYLTINKNILSNKLGIVKGRINILAMTLKSVQMLPYFKKEKVDDICRAVIKGK